MQLREEFVRLARGEGTNIRELCRRYGISPSTGYAWLERFEAEGEAGLLDRSRRPLNSPGRTSEALEARLVAARQAHPRWGARKLRRWLEDQGVAGLPSASTVQAILHRHGLVDPAARAAATPWQRFEHPRPNDLWQMDFKGHFPVGAGHCHALTVLDDHSRYGLCLGALDSERRTTTQARLTEVFRRYGLPWRMSMDNGAPWGDPEAYTGFELWLLRLGIAVSHSRPYHPQTQGKDERFHRTLKAEVLQGQSFPDLAAVQRRFDAWLPVYNRERPHEALGLATPASRYEASPRAYPENLPALEYDSGDAVRTVQGKGELSYRGQLYRLGKAFAGERVALRRTGFDVRLEVFYGVHHVATLSLREGTLTLRKETGNNS